MTTSRSGGDPAVLVITVWHEEGSPSPLRARLMSPEPVSCQDDLTPPGLAFSDQDDLLDAVRRWIECRARN